MPSKPEKARKGEPAVYSLEAHREFVLGFRKRKQARRQKAKADIEAADKQARRDTRREKREFVRSNRERALGHQSDSEDEEDGDETHVTTFTGEGGSVVTAVVAPMEVNSFDDPRVRKGHRQAAHGEQRDSQKRDDGIGEGEVAAAKKRLGVLKSLRKHGKRRVSYTHAMSKANMRKKKLKARRDVNKS